MVRLVFKGQVVLPGVCIIRWQAADRGYAASGRLTCAGVLGLRKLAGSVLGHMWCHDPNQPAFFTMVYFIPSSCQSYTRQWCLRGLLLLSPLSPLLM
jgi:hypothetical protein